MQQQVIGTIEQPATRLGEGSAVSLVALGAVLLVLGTQATALRFWARRRTGSPLLLDDWMSLPAWMSFVGAASLVLFCVGIHGLGYPRTDYLPGVPSRMTKILARALLSFNCLSILCFGTSKASALLFYHRVFFGSGQHPDLRRTILVGLLVLLAWTVWFEFMTIFQCGTHFDAPWDGTKLRYCTWSNPSIEGVAVSDVLLDAFVVALPIYLITKLATSRKNRIAIASVFLVALVGVAASIARLIIVERVIRAGREAVNEDMEYYMSKTAFYFVLEAGISVTVLNLPPIWTALGGDAQLLSGFVTLEDEERT
ncbi:hypothetical protein ISF_00720 [Cordyceps fumosorosea ARSEF 2679]|uniref:Rhodopsin domain-containing protein n=1 Tax=Cordyceps fumosorosea (strain ARSEF 2679) TaxID=1081104 RepID=A0A162N139_CORFA|nr:hypothetical protein ISF_00720 [Cordyceps fumosorosea ARSEF 2679]OAA73819.1 hypothetical protein ISF_00720 [Cordyceps fumosorosea ARSEF 2679]